MASQPLTLTQDSLFPLTRERVTEAAVLVPLVDRSGRVQVLFTQRTAHLDDHAGQISFPDGRVEAGDASREETAIRETEEEIGLASGSVAVLGRLPDYEIPSGFRITPVVGWIVPPFALKPDPFEVASAFDARSGESGSVREAKPSLGQCPGNRGDANTRLRIPPGHYPPPGGCRIWYPDRPPGQQPPPGRCGPVPPGAWVLRNPGDVPGRVHVEVYEPQRPNTIRVVGEFEIATGVFVRVVMGN